VSCMGVHFAITEEEAQAIRSIANDNDRIAYLQEEIEERYFGSFPELLAESDKAWDAMHRTLADGRLTWDGGKYPLNHAVLAGESLYSGSDYIISLKRPEQVKAVAEALALLDESAFRSRYNAIDASSYDGAIDEEDFEYTWNWFQGVRELYTRAASEGRYVLFTADQ
jgi:hypothetical protein